jgi:site-specific DNA-methyltransferase (adenine-specific)
MSFAMCEMAWTSFKNGAKIYKTNAMQLNRIHPTQKPIALYEWLLMRYAKEGDKILDTHGGSMSIALACHNLNFDLTLCELDAEYYEAGLKRLKQHQKQIRLF